MGWQLTLAPSIVNICGSGDSLPLTILQMNGLEQQNDEQITSRVNRALEQWDVTTLPERYIN
jgi:hypothetical protein